VTIKAILKADGEFISLAFEVRPQASENPAPENPASESPTSDRQVAADQRQSFGPLRLATVDDAVVLLSQIARYLDRPCPGRS
jgi:hypothetical protein